MSHKLLAKKAAFVHLVLSILLIVYGIKMFYNPGTIFPECGGDVESYEALNHNSEIYSTSRWNNNLSALLGVVMILVGIICGIMDLLVCSGIGDQEDELDNGIKFLTGWITFNCFLVIVYTVGSFVSMFINYTNTWIHISEILYYSFNLIVIRIISLFLSDLMHKKKLATSSPSSDPSPSQVTEIQV